MPLVAPAAASGSGAAEVPAALQNEPQIDGVRHAWRSFLAGTGVGCAGEVDGGPELEAQR